MKNYDIFTNTMGNIVALRKGWNWSAFLFTWIWAAFKKLFKISIIFFIYYFISGQIFIYSKDIVIHFVLFFIDLLIAIYFGLKGNELYSDWLLNHGYEFKKDVLAENKDDAIYRFNKYKNKAGQ